MLERPGPYGPFHRPFAFFLEPPAGAEPQGFKDDVPVLSCKSGPRQGVLCELEQFINLHQSPPPSQPPTPAAAKAGVGGLDRLLDSHEIIWFRTVRNWACALRSMETISRISEDVSEDTSFGNCCEFEIGHVHGTLEQLVYMSLHLQVHFLFDNHFDKTHGFDICMGRFLL